MKIFTAGYWNIKRYVKILGFLEGWHDLVVIFTIIYSFIKSHGLNSTTVQCSKLIQLIKSVSCYIRMTRVLVRWRHRSGEMENMETVTIGPKYNCTWLWYNLWYERKQNDEELTEDVSWLCAGSRECLFRSYWRLCCWAARSDLITEGDYNKMSTTSRFQVCSDFDFAPTFIIPINFMFNLATSGWNKKYLLSQGFSSVSFLCLFFQQTFFFILVPRTLDRESGTLKKVNPHSLIWSV